MGYKSILLSALTWEMNHNRDYRRKYPIRRRNWCQYSLIYDYTFCFRFTIKFLLRFDSPEFYFRVGVGLPIGTKLDFEKSDVKNKIINYNFSTFHDIICMKFSQIINVDKGNTSSHLNITYYSNIDSLKNIVTIFKLIKGSMSIEIWPQKLKINIKVSFVFTMKYYTFCTYY